MAHSHSHSHLPADANARRLLLAFSVTALFMLVEVVGGLVSGSLALLADAGHMLTDAAALFLPCWQCILPTAPQDPDAPLAGFV
jgi:cobalt-zinc-cadmium efflux system protein